ncbi:MAG: hypothetical protein IJY12_00980, partial [Clostridia bacterium]|nr:hypothetical protein [Clostridia bacterium]
NVCSKFSSTFFKRVRDRAPHRGSPKYVTYILGGRVTVGDEARLRMEKQGESAARSDRSELAEPWGFPFGSKEKASNICRDRNGCLSILRLGYAKTILFTLINHKKIRKSSQRENFGVVMTFFPFFLFFRRLPSRAL